MFRGRKGIKRKVRRFSAGFEKHEWQASNSTHYSQLGQDGVIEELFNRIGVTNKFFVEFGARMPWQLNSAYLRFHKNWQGLMMDARDPEFYWRKALRRTGPTGVSGTP